MRSPIYDRLRSKLEVFWQFTEGLAGLSRCKRLAVGCVIIPADLSEILAIGYNGPPAGVPNDSCRMEEGKCGCVHADANALVKLHSRDTGLVMILTHSPCEHCAGLVINSRRIGYVLYGGHYRDLRGANLLRSSGIVIVEIGEVTKKPPGG